MLTPVADTLWPPGRPPKAMPEAHSDERPAMFRTILRWLVRRGTAANRRDIERYIAVLENLPLRERAAHLLLAQECRLAAITQADSANRMLRTVAGVLRDYPDVDERDLLIAPTYLDRITAAARSKDARGAMIGWLVWLHTFRAAVQPRNRDLARRMWHLLREARPEVPDLYHQLHGPEGHPSFDSQTLITACDWVPEGFEPELP